MPYTAIVPNQAGFGQEQDAYLKSLLQATGDPTSDAINRLTLMSKGSGQDDGYIQALREANQFQSQGQQREIQGDVAKAYLPAAAALAKEGVGGAVLPNGDNPYLRVAPNRLNQSDAVHLQGIQAEGVKNTGAGVKDLADSGFAPPASYVGSMITPPLQDTPAPVKTYLSPGNKAKEQEAAAAMVAAQAAKYRAEKNGEGKNADKDVITYVLDGKGNRTPISETSTRKPEAQQPSVKIEPKTKIVNGHVVPNPDYKGP